MYFVFVLDTDNIIYKDTNAIGMTYACLCHYRRILQMTGIRALSEHKQALVSTWTFHSYFK